MSPLTHFLDSQHENLSFLLVYYSIYLALAVVLLAVKNLYFPKSRHGIEWYLFLTGMSATLPLALFYQYNIVFLVANVGLNVLLVLVATRLFVNHSLVGLNFYSANLLTILVGILWSVWFLVTLPVSPMTKLLLTAAAPLIVVALPSAIFQLFEQYDVLCRTRWLRARHPHPRRTNDLVPHEPFVSIHVPTYSEPPEIVIETLTHLARLNYSNYEVIVIDNNTEDASLWKPVEKYCARLGSKFRFIHIRPLAGAKGGALNFALKETASHASLIALVDADYHAEPEFLRALVGHFDDPKLGFVQTPHDYRGWKHNLYLTMCYWEYKLFFHSAMVSLSEYGAGITVGTMCIIRKKALERAGGWSETCVTEDSELAIRIHNEGYSSIYVDTTFGRGLIPDTFSGFKKQRYRWTAGPIQEFRDHFKLYTGLHHAPSALTMHQRFFHLNHGLINVLIGISLPLSFISILTVVSLIAHKEIVMVPFELWLAATILLLSNPLLTWLLFRTSLQAGLREMLSLIIANRALGHVVSYAAFRTLLTGSAQWTRTSKFRSDYSYRAALLNTKEEFFIGICLVLFIAGAFLAFPYQGLALMFLIGLSYVSLSYLAAPLFSIINIASMKRAEERERV